MNDNIYDAAAIGTDFPLDMSLIDRIEIIRGPSSSLYGTSAFLGVINIITQKGEQIKGTQLRAEGGSLETMKGSITYGDKFKSGLDLVAHGSGYQSQGQKNLYFPEFDSPETNHGIAENADQDQYEHLFANLLYKGFDLQGLHSFRKKGLAAAPFDIQFNDPRNVARDQRSYLDLSYEKSSQDQQMGFSARAYIDRYVYTADYMEDYSGGVDPLLTVNKDNVRGNWCGGEARVFRNISTHTLTGGFEFRNNFKQDQSNYDANPYLLHYDDRHSSNNGGIYFQDEWRVHPKVLLNLGIRHDFYSTFGGTTNPRLGLIFNPTKGSVFKVLYGGAFRAPNVFEMYYSDYEANLHLQPEKISTSELVFEQRLGEHLNFSASTFYNQIKQLIDQKQDPTTGDLYYVNATAAHAKGVELSMTGNWKDNIEGQISYDFQQATDDLTHDWLTNSPKHMGKANFSLPVLRKELFFGMEFQGFSKRKTKSGGLTEASYLTNLTISTRKLKNRFSLSFSVFNLFDRKNEDPASADMRQEIIVQDGRVMMGRITLFF